MKNSVLLIVFVYFVSNCFFDTSAAPAATYDQRQDGAVNVEVSLKNIDIVAILGPDEFEDGDYEMYDYADFTLKPITSRPTSPAKPVEATTSWPTVSSTSATSTVASVAGENNNNNKNDDKDVTAEQIAADSHDDSESDDSSEPANDDDDKSEQSTSMLIADLLQTALVEGIPLRTTPTKKPLSASPAEPAKEAIEETPSASPEPQAASPTEEAIGELSVKTGLPAEDPAIEKDPNADAPALVKPEESSPEENSPAVGTADENSEAPNEQTDPPKPSKRCSPGYTRNQRGQCRRLHGRRKVPASLLPFGLRLTPRIHRHRDHQSESVEN